MKTGETAVGPQTRKPTFLLLIGDSKRRKHLSPAETQSTTLKAVAWIDHLRRTGKLIEGWPLDSHRKVILKRGANPSFSRPVHSAEGISGFLLIKVEDIEEAQAIANSYLALDLGSTVEIFPVLAFEN